MAPSDVARAALEAEDETATITRAELVARLGEGAGEELFERLDESYRDDERAILANVREARQSFSGAVVRGHARMVKARRAARAGAADAPEEMVLIGLSDLEAVVKASAADFSWASAFARRRDLPTASEPLFLRPGVSGRKLRL